MKFMEQRKALAASVEAARSRESELVTLRARSNARLMTLKTQLGQKKAQPAPADRTELNEAETAVAELRLEYSKALAKLEELKGRLTAGNQRVSLAKAAIRERRTLQTEGGDGVRTAMVNNYDQAINISRAIKAEEAAIKEFWRAQVPHSALLHAGKDVDGPLATFTPTPLSSLDMEIPS